MQKDLTKGNLFGKMMQFAVPYLVACFLQTFYGMADLFITGQFNGAAAVSAVAVGSQVMHMLTVVIVGLAMGTTVCISRSVGAGSKKQAAGFIGNSAVLFSIFAAVLTVVLLLCTGFILKLLAVPAEAMVQARQYLIICFIGVPFITAYNVVSSIFRGLGDTKSPMMFVAVAGLINVGFDYILIGPMGMGAAGAAIATVGSQAFSVAIALLFLLRGRDEMGVTRKDFVPDGQYMGQLLGIGVPVAFQEGLIQVSFLVITAIANSRGVNVAAAVGIVDPAIRHFGLCVSRTGHLCDLSVRRRGHSRPLCGGGARSCQARRAVSAFLFARLRDRRHTVLFQRLFQRLREVAVFLHPQRIPGAYLASVLYPQTLYPMGLAAPMGSLLSSIICLFLYKKLVRDIIKTGEPVKI